MEENKIFYDEKKKKFYMLSLGIGALLYFFLAVVYSFTVGLATGIKYPDGITEEVEQSYISVCQMLYSVPLVALSIYFFKDDLKDELIGFGRNIKSHSGKIALGVVACYFLTIVVGIVYEALGITGESQNQDIINQVLVGPSWWPMVISVVLIAPFIEEMLFRKILCGACEYTWNLNPGVTIFISTLIFSLIHVADLENIKFIFQYIPLAFAITFSYYKSKNIFVPISIHLINNLLSVIALYTSLNTGA